MRQSLARIVGSDGTTGRFSRYVLVGGAAAVIDLGGFVILNGAGLPLAAAAAASFVIAAVFNFVLSSLIVFRTRPSWRQFLLFGTFALIGLGVNTGTTILVARWCPDVIAKVVGIGTAFLVNFWMNHTIVFAAAEGSSPRGPERPDRRA